MLLESARHDFRFDDDCHSHLGSFSYNFYFVLSLGVTVADASCVRGVLSSMKHDGDHDSDKKSMGSWSRFR